MGKEKGGGLKMKISGVVLARNEEGNIGRCLKSLGWCDEILVIDDGSTDGTVSLARKAGAKVWRRRLAGDFAAQRNFGLRKAREDWVLFVDADEVVSWRLAKEIKAKIGGTDKAGFCLGRVDVMWGRKLDHGETGRVQLLRLGRRWAGKWRRRVDEKWEVGGKVGGLKSPLVHFPHQTVGDFLEEVNFKSSLNAEVFKNEGVEMGWWDWGKPLVKFLADLIVYGGWRDGMPGFLVAVIMSFHSFLVRSKLYLLSRR